MLLDTIAAISTPRGEGGISIVRMSGQDSLNILEKIFRPKNKKVSELKNYSINYGHIIDNEHIVDKVLVNALCTLASRAKCLHFYRTHKQALQLATQ